VAVTTNSDDESLAFVRNGGLLVGDFWLVVIAGGENELDEAKS